MKLNAWLAGAVAACHKPPSLHGLVPFYLRQALLGWLDPKDAAACATGPSACGPLLRARNQQELDLWAERLAASHGVALANEGVDLRQSPLGPSVGFLDRALATRFGVLTCGVHVNGLVRRRGETYLWLARRASSRTVAPGKWDQLASSVVACHETPRRALVREAFEEAGVPAKLARRARLAGHLTYVHASRTGFTRDWVRCYDLWLPGNFFPQSVDGEVASHNLFPLRDVADQLLRPNAFKYNAALVTLDVLLRHGAVAQKEARPLRRVLRGPYGPPQLERSFGLVSGLRRRVAWVADP